MKKTFTAIASIMLLCVGTTVFAQQDPQFTMNMFNRLYTNAEIGRASCRERV